MPSITLAALLVARPTGPFWGRQWVEDVLGQSLAGYAEPHGSDQRLLGWTVGAALGAETLVQSRPVLRRPDQDPIDDLLRTPTGCTIAIFASGTSEAAKPRDMVRIARYRRWVSVHCAPPLNEKLRGALHAELPDFLAREGQSRTDAELMLRATLALLHQAGNFGKGFTAPEALRRALAGLRDRLGENYPSNVLMSDGRTLGILHQDGTLLAFEPPESIHPAQGFRVDLGGVQATVPATLLVWNQGGPPDQPRAGAERIAPGILSVQAPTPAQFVRDT